MSNGEPVQELESSKSKDFGKGVTKVVGALTAVGAVVAALSGIVKDSNDILANLPFGKSNPTAESSPSSSAAPSSDNQSDDQLYYVIAAQSEHPEQLHKEPKRAAGLEFTRSFPNVKVCPSKVDAKTYYLVLGSNLSQAEAEAMKQQARVNNFRSDTYVQPEKEIFFVPSNCSDVVG